MNYAKLGYDILPYVMTVVLGVLGYASRHLGPYLQEKLGEKRLSNLTKKMEIAEKQIQQKKGIAYDAVRWSADVFKHLGGLERLSKAVDWALNEGKKVGIDATKAQWEAAIRIAYTQIKPELNSAVSNILHVGVSSDKEPETKSEDTTSDEDPEPTPEPPKPVTEMTSSDIENIVNQAIQAHFQSTGKTSDPKTVQAVSGTISAQSVNSAQ